MSNPTGGSTGPTTARPNPFQFIFNIGKTLRLAGALLGDPRVSIFRKFFFVGSLGALILLLLLPADITAEFVSNVLPVVGPALGLPADAAFDWVALAFVAFNLMRVFPPEIVSEHYTRLFARHSTQTSAQLQAPPSHAHT